MIKVLSLGFNSSVQDLGRFGYGDIGVPVSGAMDQYSAKLANHILGNKETDAVLEITLSKYKLLFEKQTFICISGADLTPKIGDINLRLNSVIKIGKGDILTFNEPRYGVRSYLAVNGGFKTDVVLNSRSFYSGITKAPIIKKNDTLPIYIANSENIRSYSTVKINEQHFTANILEVFKGPEFELLNKKQREVLNNTLFTISKDNNRMGYRLEEVIPNRLKSMLTSAVLPGTVQLTPSGKLIVLMRDAQVTGGYPRILQLTNNAINRLAQKTTGNTFKFKMSFY